MAYSHTGRYLVQIPPRKISSEQATNTKLVNCRRCLGVLPTLVVNPVNGKSDAVQVNMFSSRSFLLKYPSTHGAHELSHVNPSNIKSSMLLRPVLAAEKSFKGRSSVLSGLSRDWIDNRFFEADSMSREATEES